MRAKAITIATIAAIVATIAIVTTSKPAESLPIHIAQDVASMAATGASGEAGSFSVTCATTATSIAGMSGFNSVACFNPTSTSVFVGGAGVTAAGFCISTSSSNCGGNSFSADLNAGAASCIVASGTQVIHCMGLK